MLVKGRLNSKGEALIDVAQRSKIMGKKYGNNTDTEFLDDAIAAMTKKANNM